MLHRNHHCSGTLEIPELAVLCLSCSAEGHSHPRPAAPGQVLSDCAILPSLPEEFMGTVWFYQNQNSLMAHTGPQAGSGPASGCKMRIGGQVPISV